MWHRWPPFRRVSWPPFRRFLPRRQGGLAQPAKSSMPAPPPSAPSPLPIRSSHRSTPAPPATTRLRMHQFRRPPARDPADSHALRPGRTPRRPPSPLPCRQPLPLSPPSIHPGSRRLTPRPQSPTIHSGWLPCGSQATRHRSRLLRRRGRPETQRKTERRDTNRHRERRQTNRLRATGRGPQDTAVPRES